MKSSVGFILTLKGQAFSLIFCKALYFDDPDGNGVELYVDTREADDERWNGENSRFDPAKI